MLVCEVLAGVSSCEDVASWLQAHCPGVCHGYTHMHTLLLLSYHGEPQMVFQVSFTLSQEETSN